MGHMRLRRTEPRETAAKPERFLVFRLAAADLRQEAALSLCLVLALSAVISPMLLVFGLKYGTIETLRQRLSKNPATLEIRVESSVRQHADLWDELRQRPDVGFFVPKTRPLSNEVLLRHRNSSTRAVLEPTASGDPVLTFERVTAPGEREVALSALAADQIGAQEGDEIMLVAESFRNGRRTENSVAVTVCAVLAARTRSVAYTPLGLLEAVEDFKDGKAVPALGWPGESGRPQPLFKGAIMLADRALPEEFLARLPATTGFSQIRKLDPEDLKEIAGWNARSAHSVYLLDSGDRFIEDRNFVQLREALRGTESEVVPWTPATSVTCSSNGESQLTSVFGLSLDKKVAEKWGITPWPPWGKEPENIYQIAIDEPVNFAGRTIQVAAGAGSNFPTFRAVASILPSAGVAFVPSDLAGILVRASRDRMKTTEPNGELALSGRIYSWMRLYARNLEDVISLSQFLKEEKGLAVSTQADRITEIQGLNSHLTRIFSFLGIVGALGGMGALSANLYASAERKKRELGVLRLLGLSNRLVLRFPLCQGLILASLGYFAACAVSIFAAGGINAVFREQLAAGESFCRLPWPALAIGYGIVIILSLLSGSLAVSKLIRQEPSSALRE